MDRRAREPLQTPKGLSELLHSGDAGGGGPAVAGGLRAVRLPDVVSRRARRRHDARAEWIHVTEPRDDEPIAVGDERGALGIVVLRVVAMPDRRVGPRRRPYLPHLLLGRWPTQGPERLEQVVLEAFVADDKVHQIVGLGVLGD